MDINYIHTYTHINKLSLKSNANMLKKNQIKQSHHIFVAPPSCRIKKELMPVGNVYHKQTVRIGTVWLDLALSLTKLEYMISEEKVLQYAHYLYLYSFSFNFFNFILKYTFHT